MAESTERLARWMYRGIWRGLVEWFRMPADPPSLPAHTGDRVTAVRPAPGYLSYLKFWFWLTLWPADVLILLGLAGAFVVSPWLGLGLLLPALALAVLPDVVAYIALHLRYDSTWYVISDRALRIRRGVWVITEVTVTFENVQNLKIQAGPVQRWFGIADLVVESAGGGSDDEGNAGHTAILQGIADAPAVRARIMHELTRLGTAGLGDERLDPPPAGAGWRPEHLAVLREIREETARLSRR